MPTYVELDFSGGGAPPVQSMGGESDHIPPGQYVLALDKVDKTPSKAGKPMATVSFKVSSGEQDGKRLVERFVFPRKGHDDSAFGQQRFHGLLVALGSKELKTKVKLDLDSLLGKKVIADVDDETQAATDSYPERTRSRPMGFLVAAKVKVKVKAKANKEEPEPEPEPEPEEEPEEEESAEEADDDPTTGVDDLFSDID